MLSDLIISSEYKFVIRIIEIFYSFYVNLFKQILGMLCFYVIALVTKFVDARN